VVRTAGFTLDVAAATGNGAQAPAVTAASAAGGAHTDEEADHGGH
jgi:hypothetical protein